MGRLVTIAEVIGSGAPVIGAAVGKRLGVPVVDREVLQRAAQEAGVSAETIGEAELAPSFLTRMVEWLGRGTELDESLSPAIDLPMLSMMTNESYRGLIEEVIRNIADTTEAVIIGHGSHVILKDYPNVLRVYLNAPISTRVARISAMEGVDLATAKKTVQEHDVARRNFFEEHYKVRRNEAQNYDLCLRTEKLDFDTCAEIIWTAAMQLGG